MITIGEFEAYKAQVNEKFSNLSSRMTQIITAHEKTLKELQILKKFHHGHGGDCAETEKEK